MTSRNFLLAALFGVHWSNRASYCYESVAVIIDTCPWTVAFDDNAVLHQDYWGIHPVGDALDYACIKLCIGIIFTKTGLSPVISTGMSML